MEKKKKKSSGAGLIAILLIAAVQMIAKGGYSKLSITLLYALIVAALFYGAYRIARMVGDSGRKASRPGGKPSGNRSGAHAKTRVEHRQSAPLPEDPSCRSAEQWKSLFEAGLIDREEYRERRNKMEKRG
ncbi:MAG: hypothetical protein LKJ17_12270 [Oscillospiraceae bacterium]|jgi:uncharacterized membrane protein|nr:hypothetical protein [Oscillospiraceae bacterium]